MIQLVSDTVIDDIVTKRGYTPTIVRDLAARYRELAQHALKLEETLAYMNQGEGTHSEFTLTPDEIVKYANESLRDHALYVEGREKRAAKRAQEESAP